MKDFLLICGPAGGGLLRLVCLPHLDLFLDARRKARQKHRDDNLPGRMNDAAGAGAHCVV